MMNAKIVLSTLLLLSAFASITVSAQTDSLVQKTATTDDDGIFCKIAYVMPEFPGGMNKLLDWIYETLVYPEDARKLGLQGRIIVQFMVYKTGQIGEAEVIHRPIMNREREDTIPPKTYKEIEVCYKRREAVEAATRSLEREALRVINLMPVWKPGMERGKPLDVRYTCPILFRLTEDGQVYGSMERMVKWFQANAVYPEDARRLGLQGRVMVRVKVHKSGKIGKAKIVGSSITGGSLDDSIPPQTNEERVTYKERRKAMEAATRSLEREALRVAGSFPDWKRGVKDGKYTDMLYTVPIQFHIDSTNH